MNDLNQFAQASEDDVERVARAICVAGGNDPDEVTWHYNGGIQEPYGARWMHHAAEARSAIAAMSAAVGKESLHTESWRPMADGPQTRAALVEIERVRSDLESFARLLRENGEFNTAIWIETREHILSTSLNRLHYGSPVKPRIAAPTGDEP